MLSAMVTRREFLESVTAAAALPLVRSQTPQGVPDWGGLMAGALISIVPLLVLFALFGKRIVNSISFSGFR